MSANWHISICTPVRSLDFSHRDMKFINEGNLVVKCAENGDGVIFRLYECFGRRTDTALDLGFDAVSAEVCNLLEEIVADTAVINGCISFTLSPYEIKTFRVRSSKCRGIPSPKDPLTQ